MRATERSRSILLGSAALLGLVLAALAVVAAARLDGQGEEPAPSAPHARHGAPSGELAVHGLAARFSDAELERRADLVVVGTAVSDVTRPFTENELIPESERDHPLYESGRYHDVQVEVSRYVKGRGPQFLSVRRLADHGDVAVSESAPVPAPSRRQLMFLSKGTGAFAGGFLVMGPQGLRDATSSSAAR